MKRRLASLLSLALAGIVIVSCAPAAPTATDAGRSSAPAMASIPQSPAKDAWQTEWAQVQESARKEGKVVIASQMVETARQALSQALKEKFGIEAEFITARPAEFAPKILAERRAGLYLEDMMLGGAMTGFSILKPVGALESLDPIIILPEALDPKAWYAGRLHWLDKEHNVLAFIASLQPSLIINTDLVGRGEIKSYRDLLAPKWKGKIVFGDPTVGGSGNTLFSALAEGIMDLNYLRDLAKQELVIIKDQRLTVEWVARGKYPIAMGVAGETIMEFKRAGAPIEPVKPAEGTYVSAQTGAILLLKNAPHPNAAKVVINWLLTREGGAVFSRSIGGHSARVDVPTDFLDPSVVRPPEGTYFMTGDEASKLRESEYLQVAKEVFGDLLK
ncbi:MAG: extracellular solute-binding protein [Chloroflexi bacterium]|nr:extracellular solute-binding protein [Chloroflexota bacterium]